VAFYGEIVATGELPVDNISSLGAIPFGGQGRHVTLAEVPPFAWPCAAQPSPRDGDVAVLTTPGLFAEGWLPRSLASEIVAAFVPSPLPVSGWDVARGGPRRTRFAAPAGAVYFTKPGLPAIDEPLSDEEDDREQGWGLALKGAWNHVS
jgi:CRISPR-associated protein Cmr3